MGRFATPKIGVLVAISLGSFLVMLNIGGLFPRDGIIFLVFIIYIAEWWVYIIVVVVLIGYFALLFIIFRAPMHKLDMKKESDTYEEDIN